MLSTHQSRNGQFATRLQTAALLWALLGAGPAAAGSSPADPATVPPPLAAEPEAALAAPDPAAVPAAPLPFLAAEHAGDRFAVSEFTKTYDEPLVVFASQSSNRSPRTLDWLDHQARIAAAAAAAEKDSSNVRVATDDRGHAATIPPEEKKALEPPKPPVSVGIPSPVAIATSLAGGLVLLVKLIAAMGR